MQRLLDASHFCNATGLEISQSRENKNHAGFCLTGSSPLPEHDFTQAPHTLINVDSYNTLVSSLTLAILPSTCPLHGNMSRQDIMACGEATAAWLVDLMLA